MKPKSKAPKRGKNVRKWLLPVIFLAILALASVVVFFLKNDTPTKVGPQFRKEGTLQFLSTAEGKQIQEIEIEIADDDLSRERGLMWRKHMEPNQGMLFIMQEEDMLAFWMLNTYISLDLLFVNHDMRIVTIRNDVQPQRLDRIPSTEPAKYVVEVNGGFCARHGIKVGDLIKFNRDLR